MLRLTVGKSGREDYYYLQEAIEAIPYNTEAEIIIKEGIYREKIFSDKRNLRIIGEGDVLITYSDSGRELMADGIKRGTFRSYTAFFSGERLYLENVTIENSAGEGRRVGQAVALYLDCDYAELDKVALLAHQDTLFLAPLPAEEREKRGFYGPRSFLPRKRNKSVFRNCYIEGTIDFIFGSGDALFESCRIVSIGSGYVTAPSTDEDGIGFVFNKSAFIIKDKRDEVYIMRPWRPYGKVSLISCIADDGFVPSLWCAWPGHEDEKNKAKCYVYDSDVKGESLSELSKSDADSAISYFAI